MWVEFVGSLLRSEITNYYWKHLGWDTTFSESLLLGPGISLAFLLPWPLQLCLLGLLCLLLVMSVLAC